MQPTNKESTMTQNQIEQIIANIFTENGEDATHQIVLALGKRGEMFHDGGPAGCQGLYTKGNKPPCISRGGVTSYPLYPIK